MSNIFESSSVESVLGEIDAIRTCTDEAGFSIVRGLVTSADLTRFRGRIGELFRPGADVRVSGSYQRGSADFQRLDLGEYPASSRFARYFFFFAWNDDRDFAEIGRTQMSIFNALTRQPSEFGFVGDSDDDRFRLSFVIQYPLGGGFMSKHREYSTKQNDRAYVVYLALTTRGVDYAKGGAYVCIDDRLVDIDATVRAGDVVIYRGDLFHGVLGIDADKDVVMDAVCGRMILTTQVKYFKKGA